MSAPMPAEKASLGARFIRRLGGGPALLVTATVVFSLVLRFPEWNLAPPEINDSILHQAMAEYAALHWNEHWPVDHWFPSVTAGFPMFAYYPHLSHLTAAALARILGAASDADRVYASLNCLLLAFMPLAIFLSARRLGLSAWASSFAAMLYPLLYAPGHFGIGWESFVWRGHGLGSQLWGMFLLFPALGWGYQAVRTNRFYAAGVLLALCTLAHFLCGYIASLSLALLLVIPDDRVPWPKRLGRLASIATVTGLVTAYFVIPFLLNMDQLLRSRWEPAWKWDSRGWEWVIPTLFRGEFFDGSHLPVLSVLVAIGTVFAGFQAIRHGDHLRRWLLSCFLIWIVLFCGRHSLGPLADLLPLSSGLHMHRFIVPVQLFGLLLAADVLDGLLTRLRPASWPRWCAITAAVIAVGAVVSLPVRERVRYMESNTRWAARAKTEVDENTGFQNLVRSLRELPPGRVHAGFHGTWGKKLEIGGIPGYGHLQAAGFDMIGYLYMAMARPGDWQVRLNMWRQDHCDLYNLRYVIAPNTVRMPRFSRLLEQQEWMALYEMPTSGYFTLGAVARPAMDGLAGNSFNSMPWNQIYEEGERWLMGSGPKEGHFLSLGADDLRPVAEPRGTILNETVGAGSYSARVAAPEPTDLILKVTYHPNWHCTANGEPLSVRPVIPGFMAVRLEAGQQEVRFIYQPPVYKKVLFLVALLVVVSGSIAGLARVARRRRNRPRPDAGDLNAG